jgi:hypothetical protein
VVDFNGEGALETAGKTDFDVGVGQLEDVELIDFAGGVGEEDG